MDNNQTSLPAAFSRGYELGRQHGDQRNGYQEGWDSGVKAERARIRGFIAELMFSHPSTVAMEELERLIGY